MEDGVKKYTKGEALLFFGFILSVFAFSLPWSGRAGANDVVIFSFIGVLSAIFGAVLLFLPYIDYELHKIAKISEHDEKRLIVVLAAVAVVCMGIILIFTIASILTYGIGSGLTVGVISSILLVLGASLYNGENSLGMYIPKVKFESPDRSKDPDQGDIKTEPRGVQTDTFSASTKDQDSTTDAVKPERPVADSSQTQQSEDQNADTGESQDRRQG
jgi:hypothetical protein